MSVNSKDLSTSFLKSNLDSDCKQPSLQCTQILSAQEALEVVAKLPISDFKGSIGNSFDHKMSSIEDSLRALSKEQSAPKKRVSRKKNLANLPLSQMKLSLNRDSRFTNLPTIYEEVESDED